MIDLPVVVVCSCGNELGREVKVDDGIIRLQLGGVVVQSAHGACAQCGREFHWSLSEKALAKLIQRVMEAG